MIDGINWIAVGMHHFFYDKINFDKSMMNAENIGKYKRTFRIFEDKKERWRKFADDAPSLYEYQKQKIYNEE
jgi:hypothetical protein